MAISRVIESGVEPGETVVVTGQLALAPGNKVDPKPYISESRRATRGQARFKGVDVDFSWIAQTNSDGDGDGGRSQTSRSKISIVYDSTDRRRRN